MQSTPTPTEATMTTALSTPAYLERTLGLDTGELIAYRRKPGNLDLIGVVYRTDGQAFSCIVDEATGLAEGDQRELLQLGASSVHAALARRLGVLETS